jgi:hypothetical protein
MTAATTADPTIIRLGNSYKGMTLRRLANWSDHEVSVWVEHESGMKSRVVHLSIMTDDGNMEALIGKTYLHLMSELRDEMRVYKEMGV